MNRPISILVLLSICSFAYGMTNRKNGDANEKSQQEACCTPTTGPAFISIGWGYSWSMDGSVSAPASTWDAAVQGYNDDVKQSEVYTWGLGYHIRPAISLLFETSYRPSFRYRKFQTSTASETPGFIGTKTRYFRLSNLAFLFNVLLNTEGDWLKVNMSRCSSFAPFLGAGVGVSYNNVYDFHSVLAASELAGTNEVESIEINKMRASIAAQATGGILFKFTKSLTCDLGYRWFFGGRFLSNNYIVDVPTGFTEPMTAPSWKGYLRANEVYLNFNYLL